MGVHPFPLLVSGDSDAMITLWPVRPFHTRYVKMLRILNMVEDNDETMIAAPITAMASYYDQDSGPEIAPGIRSGRHILITGDEQGFIKLWDMSPAIRKMKMAALREKQMPRNYNNYNPYRRCTKDGRIQACDKEAEFEEDLSLERWVCILSHYLCLVILTQ